MFVFIANIKITFEGVLKTWEWLRSTFKLFQHDQVFKVLQWEKVQCLMSLAGVSSS